MDNLALRCSSAPAVNPLPPVSAPVPDGFGSADAFLGVFASEVGGLISYVDREERIRFASRQLAEWFGESSRSVVGRTLREIHGEAAYAVIAPFMKRALAGEPV